MSGVTRTMIQGKIHRAVVTGADLHYVGSITVDSELLEAADILPNQAVDVVNIENGNRITTYAIPGPAHSGQIQLNGAAAHLFSAGDLVIIMAYAQVPDEQAHSWTPHVVFVDKDNHLLEESSDPGRVPEESPRAQELHLHSSH